MIVDMISNKKLNSLVTQLYINGRKLKISLVFITQSYFKVPTNVRVNCTTFFIMEIPNKREFQQTAINSHQIFTLKILWWFVKNVLQKGIPF